MKLVIDASNIIAGGGLTHLFELLRHATPQKYGFEKVILWAPKSTLEYLPDREWLNKKSHPLLNRGYFSRFIWKHTVFKSSLDDQTLVFIPGTGYVSGAGKVVTMCRNLLPLEMNELNRYFFSKAWIRVLMLRLLHLRAYKKADGTIFLNEYCKSKTNELIESNLKSTSIIPHGLNENFYYERKKFNANNAFNLLYVSSLDLYKHQWVIAKAVANLNKKGYDINLNLVGHSYNGAELKLKRVKQQNPVLNKKLTWHGSVDYKELPKYYVDNDAFIYGSTCETFGMTLLEAMASSLPIACSDKSSMNEMLKDAGIYFNPLSVDSCEEAIVQLVEDKELRKSLGKHAYQIAQNYSWERCSNDTFKFLGSFSE